MHTRADKQIATLEHSKTTALSLGQDWAGDKNIHSQFLPRAEYQGKAVVRLGVAYGFT